MGKLPSGLLDYHTTWLGSYDECVAIEASVTAPGVTTSPYKGRYCKADLKVGPLGVYILLTRKRSPRKRGVILLAQACKRRRCIVDVTWSVCISIKQFDKEFKVRSHLGNTNFYHIHLYNLTRFGHFYFLYVYCVTSLITFACLTKIALI